MRNRLVAGTLTHSTVMCCVTKDPGIKTKNKRANTQDFSQVLKKDLLAA